MAHACFAGLEGHNKPASLSYSSHSGSAAAVQQSTSPRWKTGTLNSSIERFDSRQQQSGPQGFGQQPQGLSVNKTLTGYSA